MGASHTGDTPAGAKRDNQPYGKFNKVTVVNVASVAFSGSTDGVGAFMVSGSNIAGTIHPKFGNDTISADALTVGTVYEIGIKHADITAGSLYALYYGK